MVTRDTSRNDQEILTLRKRPSTILPKNRRGDRNIDKRDASWPPQEYFDRDEALNVELGRPLPWEMRRHQAQAVLFRHGSGTLTLSVIVDVGRQPDGFWNSTNESAIDIRLFPSGPNIWCLTTVVRTNRIPVSILMGRRELHEMMQDEAPKVAGLIQCEAGVVRKMGPTPHENMLWPILVRWAKDLELMDVSRNQMSILARHDLKLLTTAEMHAKAGELKAKIVARTKFQLNRGAPVAEHAFAQPKDFPRQH